MLSLLEPRYKRILQMLAEGHSSKEIAKVLGISSYTVDSYIKDLKHRFIDEPEANGRLPNRTALVTIYRRLYQTPSLTPEPIDVAINLDWSFDQLLTLSRVNSNAATMALR